MTATETQVSVVLPCLNEARTIGQCVREALDAMRNASINGEVVVADNGSEDGSQKIAIEVGARVIPVTRKGYGSALYAGISAARGQYILMGDADGSYDFSHLPRFIGQLQSGADLVMGNRFLGGIESGAMPWKNRYIGNPVLSFIGRLFFNSAVGDFHCGLRAFTAQAFRRMDLRTTGMEFASEMVIKSVLLGLRVEEVPTVLRKDGRGRPPHLRPWRDGWRHLRFMLLFSPRWLFWYPGICLMTSGLAGGVALIRGPIQLGKITLDIHTLLFSAVAVLIGFQAVSFAMLSKYFAVRSGLRRSKDGFKKLFHYFTMETGLATGFILIAAGLGLSAYAVCLWGDRNFGPLQPSEMLRLVIPGVLSLVLGCQLTLNSFFLGVIQLDTRSGKP